MSNQINEEWAEKEYERGLDRLGGEEEEIVKLQVIDPDEYRDNEEDR
jgi:hypothetical protein